MGVLPAQISWEGSKVGGRIGGVIWVGDPLAQIPIPKLRAAHTHYKETKTFLSSPTVFNSCP